jgi:hypothetical protein
VLTPFGVVAIITSTTTQQLTRIKIMLPTHLQNLVKKIEANNAEFTRLGGNLNWHKEALEAAEKSGNDNNLIHAVIPA